MISFFQIKYQRKYALYFLLLKYLCLDLWSLARFPISNSITALHITLKVIFHVMAVSRIYLLYLFDSRYCPNCKNDETAIVRIGEKLKASKKKSKMPSANSASNRDWGKVKTQQCRLRKLKI